MHEKKGLQALHSEELTVAISRLDDAIGVQEEKSPFGEIDDPGLVLRLRQDAQRQTRRAQLEELVPPRRKDQRWIVARGCEGELASIRVEKDVAGGRESDPARSGLDQAVRPAKDGARVRAIMSAAPIPFPETSPKTMAIRPSSRWKLS